MLEQRIAQEKGYITLKEAAELSSYSADYVGQLIRSGKIQGEQVYSNVAWVTTEESVLAYMSSKNKANFVPDSGSNLGEVVENFGVYALYLVVAMLAVMLLLLFYILSVSIDAAIEKRVASEPIESIPAPKLVEFYE